MSTAVWRLQVLRPVHRAPRSTTASGTTGSSAGPSSGAPGRSAPREAVAVRDGSLRLMVLRDPADSSKYLNGHIGTQGRFSFTRRRGRRADQVPAGQGQHGAFWMQPDAPRRIPGDAAPQRSRDRRRGVLRGRPRQRRASARSSTTTASSARGRAPGGSAGCGPAATAKLGRRRRLVEELPRVLRRVDPASTYTFRVDGRPHWRTRAGVSGIDEHLILSLLTSDYELPGSTTPGCRRRMHVDWVRVWQK